jgi:tetraacyldisaccharide 4'-kinase
MRETMARGFARAQAVVMIGRDATGISARIPRGLPLLRARLAPDPQDAAAFEGRRVLALAGIGRPQKFFDSLAEIGAKVISKNPFPDHHPYAAAEIEALLAEAVKRDAVPVTTTKDAVRLPPHLRPRVRVLRVTLACDRPEELNRLLSNITQRRAERPHAR